MAFSYSTERALLDALYHGSGYTAPAGLWLALFTTPPYQGGTGGIEISGGGYARKQVSFALATGGGPATTTNSNQVQFPTASAAWGTVTGAAIFDASMGGTLIDVANLTTPKVVGEGDTLIFPLGSVSISLD